MSDELSYYRVILEGDALVDLPIPVGLALIDEWEQFLSDGKKQLVRYTDNTGSPTWISLARIIMIGLSDPPTRAAHRQNVAAIEAEGEGADGEEETPSWL